MAGTNFGFKYHDEDNEENLIALLVKTRDNLNMFFNITVSGQNILRNNKNIHYYEIIFRQIDSKFLSDIRVDKKSLIYKQD